MSTTVTYQGLVTGAAQPNTGSGNIVTASLNQQQAQRVVQNLAPNAQMALQGNIYVASHATAVAPAATVPTTTASFSIWNNSIAKGTKVNLIILRVGYTTIASAGAAFQGQELMQTEVTAATTLPSGTAGVGPVGLGGQTGAGNATAQYTVTIGNTGLWTPVGPVLSSGTATATIGMGNEFALDGTVVVAPGCSFSLAFLCSSAGSATIKHSVTWAEVPVFTA